MARPGPIQYLSSEEELPVVTDKPKKGQKLGRAFDRAKAERCSGHVLGTLCKCKRRCTELLLSHDEQQCLLDKFNAFKNRDAQDSYLSGLIRLLPVARRRARRVNAKPMQSSYKYVVQIDTNNDNVAKEVVICYSAFQSVHGITNNRVQTLKKSLLAGEVHVDRRGKHANRPHKLPVYDGQSVIDHIGSFRSRKAHYSRRPHRKVYLPENLSIIKMFRLYKEQYPCSKATYRTYRETFSNKFDIGFGYPRCDTCSACDEYIAKVNDIKKRIKETTDGVEITDLNKEKRALKVAQECHKRKAEAFYERKRVIRETAKTDTTMFALAMDFSKNLASPNIATNDVYYKR